MVHTIALKHLFRNINQESVHHYKLLQLLLPLFQGTLLRAHQAQ